PADAALALAPAGPGGASGRALSALAAGAGLQRSDPRVGAGLRAPGDCSRRLEGVAARRGPVRDGGRPGRGGRRPPVSLRAARRGGGRRVPAGALAGAEHGPRFLSALLVVVAVAAVVGLLQTAACPGPDPDYGWPYWIYHRCYRARGFFSIYMTLAGVLSLVLLACLPRLLPGAVAPRWTIAPWLVSLLGLLATYTRGAWVGFGTAVLSLLPITRKGRWLLLAGLVLLAIGALAGPKHLRERFLTMGNPEDPTVKERVYMWRSGLAIWREHPVLGVGPGELKRVYERYALPEAVKKRPGHVHNTPLQMLVERGVLGLAAWLWIWVAFFARAIGRLRRLPAEATSERTLVMGSLAAIVGFLVAGLSEFNFGDSEVVM